MAIVQPEAAGEAPSGPVSWYGVASPAALSGFAGTTISQSELADGGGGTAFSDGHGFALGDAAGAGATLELVGDAAGAGAAAELGADAAGADGVPLSAVAMGAAAAASDMAGLADPAAAGAAQAPGRPAALLEALSMALMCGALTVVIPAASATVRSPIIGARRARGCCGWPL